MCVARKVRWDRCERKIPFSAKGNQNKLGIKEENIIKSTYALAAHCSFLAFAFKNCRYSTCQEEVGGCNRIPIAVGQSKSCWKIGLFNYRTTNIRLPISVVEPEPEP